MSWPRRLNARQASPSRVSSGGRALRSRRDAQAWQSALRRVEDAARSGANLMPHIISAVENYSSVGEISDALRRVFGEYKEAVVI